MRNPPFDPNAILIEDQRSERYRRGLDMENRYRDALARYMNRNVENLSEPAFQEYLDLLYPQKKTVDAQAVESRAKYGSFPTIRSAGQHARSLNPVLRKLLGL